MLPKNKQVVTRLKWFAKVQEEGWTVAKTCRYFGISRKTYYKWFNRYTKNGISGLYDRSKAPIHRPNKTRAEIVEKIIHLRKHYHLGPLAISMYLKRYHDICINKGTIYCILRRANLNKLPVNQKHISRLKRFKRYEKALPGNAIQIDVKFIMPLEGVSTKKYYQYTAIDDCSRLRILKIYDKCNQKNSIDFLKYVLNKLPFETRAIQTDNGGEFGYTFHWTAIDLGIKHIYIKPRTPRLNGKVERSHRIDKDEFYKRINGVVIKTTDQFNVLLSEWEQFYNFQRPHGALDGKTPYEKFREKVAHVKCYQ